jgi:hypothetical protein
VGVNSLFFEGILRKAISMARIPFADQLPTIIGSLAEKAVENRLNELI